MCKQIIGYMDIEYLFLKYSDRQVNLTFLSWH
jgi:hypothetical protein